MPECAIKKVVVTGPESTGKSSLCASLAEHYQGLWVPELAREVVENLGRPYRYADVEEIARAQVRQFLNPPSPKPGEVPLVFYDTWLILTKVWFRVVFGRVPDWMDDQIRQARGTLFLVCAPDIPWVYDPVRENPHRRQELFDQYIAEIEEFGFDYRIITGQGIDRSLNAIREIDAFFAGLNRTGL